MTDIDDILAEWAVGEYKRPGEAEDPIDVGRSARRALTESRGRDDDFDVLIRDREAWSALRHMGWDTDDPDDYTWTITPAGYVGRRPDHPDLEWDGQQWFIGGDGDDHPHHMKMGEARQRRLSEAPWSDDEPGGDYAGDAARFEEIIQEINTLTREAMKLLSDAAKQDSELRRAVSAAEGYWYGHIMAALGGEWSGGRKTHATTMADSLEALTYAGEPAEE